VGTITIRCPKTGRAISTGREVASAAAFRSVAVFFGRTYCTHCRVTHEWFAQDGWVCEPQTRPHEDRRPLRLHSALANKVAVANLECSSDKGDAMGKTITRLNIEPYRKVLAAEQDETKR